MKSQKRLIIMVLLLLVCIPATGTAQMLTGYQKEARKEPLDREATPQKPDYRRPPVPVQPAPAPVYQGIERDKPVDLTADTMEHDEASQTITAAGNVELIQGERTLRADRIIYDLRTDTVRAEGNIVLAEPNGDIHYAESVELNDEMRTGFVAGLHSFLIGGGKFRAQKGVRREDLITMYDASYTPCDCKGEEGEEPGWQIKAKEVTYNEADHKISYKDARFEVMGVPVMWTPYLAHPDGKVKRKSGLLAPQVGFDSQLGFVVSNNYYWAIAPDKDATVGVMLTTEEIPVGLAEYRQRFENAAIEISGSGTHSSRTDSIAGENVKLEDDWRGHLFAEGLWDINEKWRSGLNIEVASDDQYLRQYDFSGKDVLENELYAERFSGRNYAVGRVLAFQDIRVREEQTDQPNILPEIEVNMLGDPNQTLGGRWALDLSMLELERHNDEQDMTRLVAQAGWHKRHVMDFGLINTVRASVRGDAYHARDRDVALPGSGRSDEGSETRIYPRLHAVSSYPLAKPMQSAQAIIEPTAALTLSPDINVGDSNIPNEDSQDVQIDASNLFEPSRFPGKDRIEDGSHLTYGLRTGLYGYGGSYADLFLGQSHRFDEENNPFPEGSGLSEQQSDIVGQLAMMLDSRFGLNYRFQLENDSLASQRHELDAYAHWERIHLGTRYLFAKALEGTDIDESREQIENSLAYDVTKKWRLRTGALHDLGEEPGLRKAVLGLDYFGCCVSFSATAERNLTTDSSGDSGTDITFRIGLKGLGEFETAGGGGDDAERRGW